MKKFILSVLCAIAAISLTANAGSTTSKDKEVIIIVRGDSHGTNAPRGDESQKFAASVDTDLGIVYVAFLANVGDIDIEVENLSSGWSTDIEADTSSAGVIIPISAAAGSWLITITLSNGTKYFGEFEI